MVTRRVLRPVVVLLAAAVLAVACSDGDGDESPTATATAPATEPAVRGSGEARTDERVVGEFTRLVVRSAADVRVRLGSPPSVKVTADENVLDLLTIGVEEGALVIASEDRYITRLGVDVEVVAPGLQAVEFDGLGEVRLEGVTVPRLNVAVRAGGVVAGSGSTDALELDATGSARARLFDLVARRVKVALKDSAQAEVHAVVGLDATIDGSGSVVFEGEPQDLKITSSATATGKVRPRQPPQPSS